jgi:histidinol phosphatase-like PHP family hydrolase
VVTHSRGRRNASLPAPPEDENLAAASLLQDMAILQPTERSRFGYKRAAKAIVGLTSSIRAIVGAGELRQVPFVGPASARIVEEYLDTGASPTVDAAVARSGQGSRVEAARTMRGGFLSEYAMRQALAAAAPNSIVSPDVFRGDFQMHSEWSDGGESLETMIEACLGLGHSCLGITDHSYGLPIARGMSMDAVARQHEEIDALNRAFAGRFRVFKGIEANILADGSFDLQPDERRHFEFVVASPHSLLRRTEDQTARMLTAVQSQGVAILGHPRGRIFNTRAGVQADWPRVFAAAAERGVAVEIDGNWHRQDLDYRLAAEALEKGCLFALDSDAHSIGELRFTQYSIAHARLAGIPSDRVINCWSDDRLSEWMAARHEPTPSRPGRTGTAGRGRRPPR